MLTPLMQVCDIVKNDLANLAVERRVFLVAVDVEATIYHVRLSFRMGSLTNFVCPMGRAIGVHGHDSIRSALQH